MVRVSDKELDTLRNNNCHCEACLEKGIVGTEKFFFKVS